MSFCVRPGVVWRPLSDGGAFVVDPSTGESLGLNRSAARMLGLLAEGWSPERIAQVVARRHGIDAERALRDLEELLTELERSGMVVRVEEENAPRS